MVVVIVLVVVVFVVIVFVVIIINVVVFVVVIFGAVDFVFILVVIIILNLLMIRQKVSIRNLLRSRGWQRQRKSKTIYRFIFIYKKMLSPIEGSAGVTPLGPAKTTTRKRHAATPEGTWQPKAAVAASTTSTAGAAVVIRPQSIIIV